VGEFYRSFTNFLGNDVLIEIIKIEVIHITEWEKVWEGDFTLVISVLEVLMVVEKPL